MGAAGLYNSKAKSMMEAGSILEKPLAGNGEPLVVGDKPLAGVDKPLAGKKSCQKSVITNGTQFLPGIKNTTAWARRCRDIIGEHISDLGGVDNTSAAERSLVRRIGVLTTETEMLESEFALAGQPDGAKLDLYQRTTGNLRRLLETLGLKRRAKPVKTLADLRNADDERERQRQHEPGWLP